VTRYNDNNNNNNKPADRNVVQKEAEKKIKYKSLFTEIQQMWNLKRQIAPIIIGDAEIVTQVSKKIWKPYQENFQHIHYKRQL
jgi:hypothetical protein